jgi:hypothetical protein
MLSIPGITLVIILVAIFLYLVSCGQSGGSAIPGYHGYNLPISNKDPHFLRQYLELDNINNVLNRPLEKANPHINSLKVHCVTSGPEADVETDGMAQEFKAAKYYLDFADPQSITATPEDKTLAKANQHYFLDESLVLDREETGNYYWDWRYPRQPISIKFAHDPVKFIKEHPMEYPSYIVKSRDYQQLQPHLNDEGTLSKIDF